LRTGGSTGLLPDSFGMTGSFRPTKVIRGKIKVIRGKIRACDRETPKDWPRIFPSFPRCRNSGLLRRVISNDLAMQVALMRTGVRLSPLADLTPRELQTLSLLAEGKACGRIAEELHVSYKTVVSTCSQLKDKLHAKNLPELIRLAVQHVSARS
jgi:DNA-binding CsgD family transcriptional regulator